MLLVERGGNAPLVVKDYGPRSWVVRRLLAPVLVRHELAMLEKVAGLPGVPRPAGRIDRLALAMEWIPGIPLQRRSHRSALPGPFFTALEGILAGLAERGVVHLDLSSPSNILATESGAPALVDLGGALAIPVPRALRGALERRALRKLRSRFESGHELEQPTVAPVDYSELDLGSARLCLRESGPLGDPVPVLLLHELGLSGRCFRGWLARAPALARRLIAVDLPGFGGSRAPRGRLAPADLAHRLAELLAALRVPRCEVIGFGLGGLVALALARERPDAVRAIATVDAPRGRPHPRLCTLAEKARTVPTSLPQALRTVIPAGLAGDLRSELAAELDAVPMPVLRRVLRELERLSTVRGVSPVPVPWIDLASEGEWSDPLERAEALLAELAKATAAGAC